MQDASVQTACCGAASYRSEHSSRRQLRVRHCTRGKRAAASSFRRWQLSRSTHYLIRELTRRNEQVTIWLKRNQAAHPVKTGAQVIVRQAKTDTEVMIQAKVVARYNKHALLAE